MNENKIIADTTRMFVACACLALHKRNEFGKARLMQFIADVTEINDKMELSEIEDILKDTMDMEINYE